MREEVVCGLEETLGPTRNVGLNADGNNSGKWWGALVRWGRGAVLFDTERGDGCLRGRRLRGAYGSRWVTAEGPVGAGVP